MQLIKEWISYEDIELSSKITKTVKYWNFKYSDKFIERVGNVRYKKVKNKA
jgi:hypothetical protein